MVNLERESVSSDPKQTFYLLCHNTLLTVWRCQEDVEPKEEIVKSTVK